MTATLTTTELSKKYVDQVLHMDIEITGSQSIGTNRWQYEWQRVVTEADGAYAIDTENPLSNATEGYGYGYNTIEANNTGSGIEGSGDDMSHAEPQYNIEMKPIGPGAVLLRAVMHPNAQDDIEVFFSAPNNVEGGCP